MAKAFTVPRASFFDSVEVLAAIDKKTNLAQRKFGAFVRRAAQTSIRYRKGHSKPGQPPFAHRDERFTRTKTSKKTGKTTTQAKSPLRELIFFSFDKTTRSVVVGPTPFGAGSAIVPGLLERGGRSKSPKSRFAKAVSMAPRPFMKPALMRELPKFAGLFRG